MENSTRRSLPRAGRRVVHAKCRVRAFGDLCNLHGRLIEMNFSLKTALPHQPYIGHPSEIVNQLRAAITQCA
jgi:hypothetical protein